MENYAFISYAAEDVRFARSISESLNERGISHWLDKKELLPGDSLIDRLQSAIKKADHFIIILSSRSIHSNWVDRELKAAIHLQQEKGSKFIIPAVIDNCPIPLFLVDLVFADFRKKESYENSINLLIKAINGIDKPVNSRQDIYSRKLLQEGLDMLERELNDDPWVSSFRNFPLNTMWLQALELNSYGGSFRASFLTGLVMGTNISQEYRANTFLTMVTFAKEVEANDLLNPDLMAILVEIVEEENIEATNRILLIPYLNNRYKKATTRKLKLSLLPDLFTVGRNNLANLIIQRAFGSDHKDQLDLLWEMGSPVYREQILSYLNKYFDTGMDEGQIEKFALENDVQFLRVIFKDELRPIDFSVDKTQISWLSFQKDPDAGHFAELLEDASRLAETQMDYLSAMADIFSSSDVDQAMASYGPKPIFDFLIRVIESPNINAIVSMMALYEIGVKFGYDSLAYRSEFPGCLLGKRRFREAENESMLAFLIQAAITDPFAMITLGKLIEMFPIPPFWYAVTHEMDQQRVKGTKFSAIRKYILGSISLASFQKAVYSS